MLRDTLDDATAEALIGIDTIWGGDVMNPSGTGRFIADCWFSDEPLPVAYAHPAAAALRANGGAGAKTPDALQLAAALGAGCRTFVTNDRRLPAIPGLRVIQLSKYAR